MKKHSKHPAIARPSLGTFGRNEWAILGTPCGKIQQLAFHLTKTLSKKWNIGFVDADHKSADGEMEKGRDEKSAMAHGASLEYIDKITFHRFDKEGGLDNFQFRPQFNNMDGILVNGNHFKAKQQIVIVDPKKEDSLKRKLDRLTDVQLILLTENVEEPYGFLKGNIIGFDKIPVLRFNEIDKVAALLDEKLRAAVPVLNGLVLAGGKSVRMGKDKGLIDYHGMPQRNYMATLVKQLCEKTYFSCRPDQVDELAEYFPTLPDTFTGLGPMGAILTAFREQPDVAWLVVACDLPLLDKNTLDFLIEKRNPSKIATTFRSPVNQFPEPLVTIWEPRAYPVLLQFLAQGYSCPRKALINSPVHVLEAPREETLMNVNTPEEYEALKLELNCTDKAF